MADVQVTVSLPEGSVALAMGLKDLVLKVVAAHKAGGGLAVEASADVLAAVAVLPAALSSIGLLADEAKTELPGLVEAFALAGGELTKALLQK